jgi:hypothetical protein
MPPLGPTVSSTQPQGNLKTLLSSDGVDVGVPYYSMAMSWRGDDRPAIDVPHWTNVAGPEAGALLALLNARGTPKVSDDDSAIAWRQWQKAVLTADPAATDFSGLSSYWRTTISNSGTKGIIFETIAGQSSFDQTFTFTPTNTDQKANPFWALLGTENGKGIVRLLTDYKVAMRGKGITILKAKLVPGPRATQDWTMWATIG